jgi:hypothetical protein
VDRAAGRRSRSPSSVRSRRATSTCPRCGRAACTRGSSTARSRRWRRRRARRRRARRRAAARRRGRPARPGRSETRSSS